ncbi:5,10-methylene tetrahydromethanopterin reductase [Rhodococcoides fascians]|uniref:LLM class flavin-dependent oxidoreductase n=1 Tax=Rhodococcoides fascians TaxID=1828 RepID=UPI000B9B325A|nr:MULTISPECIES: LLM class flavin-dependent oxidoreductase [Rhodococcus]OZD68959.1 5,10-methylene tetrahydromethanopterin reductase [Rhodococcus sp. 06-1059B-a]OZE81359.1 5,10-methylene tetrahydromethanopterin reductase [Rhodococcus fascians]OZF10183.1 5,10-methylene tetrahydromethanopterin reductase [Rhodococcus fascians]OZF13274.1 5,10-methylene tetrahydromethanopterin reductase [Rhodococcus fascians]OZF59371.1 5,10-methylene tetrahydromethanopterin reductase [Rhodococcus fascians]
MRRIHLHAFKIAGVGHSAIGTWRNPYQQEHRYTELEYWQDTARVLERGLFDSLFMADFPGLNDVHNGSTESSFREAITVPLNDPSMAISAMAAVTRHVGFAVTASTTYEQPYSFARKMTTLDHLTNGRVGWNIVTSATASAARNLGLDRQVPHDERYAIADEFLEVVYKLWEGSWEDDALIRDVNRGIYTDPSKVHPAAHKGTYFSVPDAFLCEPSRQRTPALFQAGMSSSGQEFAAKHAEAIFLLANDAKGLRRSVDATLKTAAQYGRMRDDFQFVGGVSVVVAPTDEEAQAKLEQQLKFVSVEGTLARQSSLMQLDFGSIDIDAPLEHVKTDGVRSLLERYTVEDPDRVWTPRQVAEKMARSLGAITVVGSPTTVADQLEMLMDDGDIDGFNVYDNLPLRSLPDFVDLVVPELQRRGRYPREYSSDTLRGNLSGTDRLTKRHIGANYRHEARVSSAGQA